MTCAEQIPLGFKYRDVLLAGRPTHEKYSEFYIKHPPMPASRWAKIYAPFDALRGFDDCIKRQQTVYEEKRQLDEDEARELSRRLEILKNLTWNKRMAKANRISATVTYFHPARSGNLGTYETMSGIIWKVDTDLSQTVKIGDCSIDLDDIISIEAKEVFDRDWELESI